MTKFVGIEVDDRELQRQIKAAMARNPQETMKAIMDCVLDLAAASAKVAPIESGDLRSNCHGTVNGSTLFKDQQQKPGLPLPSLASVGEVGYSLPYALRQHEDLTLRHDRTDGRKIMTGVNAGRTINMVAGGQAKFLEGPFNERVDRYIKRMEEIPERVIK